MQLYAFLHHVTGIYMFQYAGKINGDQESKTKYQDKPLVSKKYLTYQSTRSSLWWPNLGLRTFLSARECCQMLNNGGGVVQIAYVVLEDPFHDTMKIMADCSNASE